MSYFPKIAVDVMYGGSSNSAPTLVSVTVTGTESVGNTLTATPNGYADAEGDLAGTHLYMWVRADDEAGTNSTEIVGATSATYVLQGADEDKYVQCGIRPVALTGTSPGIQVLSSWMGNIEP